MCDSAAPCSIEQVNYQAADIALGLGIVHTYWYATQCAQLENFL